MAEAHQQFGTLQSNLPEKSPDSNNGYIEDDIESINTVKPLISSAKQTYSDGSAPNDSDALNNGVPKKNPNYMGATFNLLNVIVGVGILGLPYVFYNVGIVIGLLLLILVALGTVLSYWFLLQSSNMSRQHSYEDLAQFSMGSIASIITKIIIIVDTFGSLAAYMVVVADSTHRFISAYVDFPDQYAILDKRILLAFSLVIIIPLSLLKRINMLAFTSFLSLVPLVYLVILQVVEYASMLKENKIVGDVPWVNGNFFVALPIVVFSFSSQLALYPIYKEMRDRWGGDSSDMLKVVRYSVSFTILCYSLCGLFGVLAFPTDTKGNILLNYESSVPMDILLVSMTIAVILGYPLTIFPCRESIDRLFFPGWDYSYPRLAVITLVVITLTYTIAALIPSFSTILGLSGAITKTAIGYVLPPLFYIMIKPSKLKEDKQKIAALVILIVGTSAGIASAVATIVNYVQKANSDVPIVG